MDILQNICEKYNIQIEPITESNNNYIWWSKEIIIKQYLQKDNFLHEQEALSHIQQLQKPYFPKIIDSYPEEKILLIQRLPWQDLEKNRELTSPENREKIYRQLIQILCEIHSITAPIAYQFSKNRYSSYLNMYEKAKQNPHISQSKIEEIHQLVLTTNTARDNLPCVLIHNDFRVKNIFSDTKDITWIIDFENWFYGPLVLEWLKIKRDLTMITMLWCTDTSPQEIDFMHGLISFLEKEYPEIFGYTQNQYNNFYSRECIFKLSRHNEDRYDHKETEWMIKQLFIK